VCLKQQMIIIAVMDDGDGISNKNGLTAYQLFT
jgi:hypothetical protein